MKKVVIIGGGFGGINLAKGLYNNSDFEVTIVDRNNYHFFPPLLYQIATGYLDPSNICYPYRRLLRNKKNMSFHMAEFKQVCIAEKKVILSTGEINYDYLIFATGTKTNYFGLENVQRNALPMKTLNDAMELRNYFLQIMEKATKTNDELERKKLLTVVVAGAGPTGIEISGMLAEMRKNIVPKDYPELTVKNYETHIYLVDGSDKVLASMCEKSQAYTFRVLNKMGIEILLDTHVKDYVNDQVYFSDDSKIATKTLVWAAGVTCPVFDGMPVQSLGRGKRILVNEFNEVLGLTDVFAIGDSCLLTADKNYPNGHPQIAQPAIQQGKLLAKNMVAVQRGKEKQPFAYYNKGDMAIIGFNKAVADLPKPKIHLQGFFAWITWLTVHVMFLVNYRNRIRTFYNWITAYFTKDQSLRFIVQPKNE